MLVYFDSSAFSKRYVQEAGSEAVLAWCANASAIVLSAIALPEIISVFCRLQRERKISVDQYQQLKTALLVDVADIMIVDTVPEVIHQAIMSLEVNVLRGMDAIHIGCALAIGAELFISGDNRQCEAAKRAGLNIESV